MNNRPWLAHYDKGVPQTIDYPKAPLFHFLEEAARMYPDRACTIFKGAVISYKEMNEQTNAMAAALIEMGVKRATGWNLYAEFAAICDCLLWHSKSWRGGGGDQPYLPSGRDHYACGRCEY